MRPPYNEKNVKANSLFALAPRIPQEDFTTLLSVCVAPMAGISAPYFPYNCYSPESWFLFISPEAYVFRWAISPSVNPVSTNKDTDTTWTKVSRHRHSQSGVWGGSSLQGEMKEKWKTSWDREAWPPPRNVSLFFSSCGEVVHSQR